MVLRVLRQMILSGKVRYIQLVGAKDKLIYSKQAKEIVDELMNLAPHLVHAA
ncbi:arginase/agmatinase/formimionoglutamate hydrolase [Vibrio cholerae]|nr:arginase/agmatinase/formimionoglutamate hydrolase [Vibrio cholerae]